MVLVGILTIIAALAVRRAYDDGAFGDDWALLWAVLLGWNIHSLLSML